MIKTYDPEELREDDDEEDEVLELDDSRLDFGRVDEFELADRTGLRRRSSATTTKKTGTIKNCLPRILPFSRSSFRRW